jgi:hypothetical protein
MLKKWMKINILKRVKTTLETKEILKNCCLQYNILEEEYPPANTHGP